MTNRFPVFDSTPSVSIVRAITPFVMPLHDELHFHTNIEISICLSGSGISEVNGITQRFSAGDISVFLPFQAHRNQADPLEKSLFRISFIDPAEIARKTGNNFSVLIRLMRSAGAYGNLGKNPDTHAVLFIRMLLDEIECGGKYGQADDLSLHRIYALLYLLLEELCRSKTDLPRAELPGKYEVMNTVLDGIQESLENGIQPSVEEIAGMNFISESACRRLFRDVLKISPKRYVSACAVSLAQFYLSTTRMSVLEIAGRCGFNDISTFNRTFFSLAGMTPTAFRKSESSN